MSPVGTAGKTALGVPRPPLGAPRFVTERRHRSRPADTARARVRHHGPDHRQSNVASARTRRRGGGRKPLPSLAVAPTTRAGTNALAVLGPPGSRVDSYLARIGCSRP